MIVASTSVQAMDAIANLVLDTADQFIRSPTTEGGTKWSDRLSLRAPA